MKEGQRLLQRFSLLVQRERRRRDLLNQRGILLGGAVHLVDGGTDLANPPILLVQRLNNVVDDQMHVRHRLNHLFHHYAGLIDQLNAFADAA